MNTSDETMVNVGRDGGFGFSVVSERAFATTARQIRSSSATSLAPARLARFGGPDVESICKRPSRGGATQSGPAHVLSESPRRCTNAFFDDASPNSGATRAGGDFEVPLPSPLISGATFAPPAEYSPAIDHVPADTRRNQPISESIVRCCSQRFVRAPEGTRTPKKLTVKATIKKAKVPVKTPSMLNDVAGAFTAKTSICCCARDAKRTATFPGASHLQVTEVTDDDTTLHPVVCQPFRVEL